MHDNTRQCVPFRLTGGATAVAALLAALSTSASGQEAPATQAEPVTKVVVTGVRQSVISAIERKKGAATITDSIVAEDIGQFPDKNIGEALSRVTGIQIGNDFGEGNQVSIRGVQPDLNRIEINGMSVLSTGVDGSRAPELRELPSELIKSIDVVKGVTADITEGGLGGSVLIKTNKPLDFKKRTIAINGAAEHNTLRNGVQPRGSLLIADRFLDGKLGLMGNMVYDKVLTQADRVRNSGWRFIRDWDLSAEKTVQSTNTAAAAVADRNGCSALTGTNRSDCERQWFDYSPSTPRYGLWTRDHKRMTGEFTAQYQFSDAFNAWASFQRSKQDSWFNDRNYQTDFASADRLANAGTLPTYNAAGVPSGGSCVTPAAGATPAGMVVTNHHVTEYTLGNCVAVSGRGGYGGFSTQARDFNQRVDQYYRSTGFQFRRGAWDVEGMLSTTDASYQNDTNFVGLTMNVPGLKVTLDGQGFPRFTFPANANPDNSASYTQVQMNYNPVELDTFEDQVKLDVRYRTPWPVISKLHVGIQGRKYGSQRYADGGYVLDAGGNLTSTADDLDVMSSNVRYTVNYDPLNRTGNLRPPTTQSFIDSNNRETWVNAAQMAQLIDSIRSTTPNFLSGSNLQGFPGSWMTPSYDAATPYFDTSKFTHDLVRQAPGRDGNLYPQIPTYDVKERIRAAYVRADYDFTVGSYEVMGNIGVRYAGTKTRSMGRQRLFQRVERTPGSATFDDRQISNTIVGKENSYHDVLPSANAATWLLPDTLVLRAGYGKVMARPNLDRLNPNFSCTINSGNPQFGGDGFDNCTGGNPDLKPYRAANKDLSLEWYPNRESQLSLAYFRKDIGTAIQNNVLVRKDLLGNGTLYDITTTVNFAGATTKGYELSGRTALTFLPGVLRGLGVDANVTRMSYDYAKGGELINSLDGSGLPFPGMSRTSYNLGLWYDLGPVNARLAYNHRSGYYTGSNDSNTNNPLFAEPTGFLDAKIQYRVTPQLSVSLEAKNLTDEASLTTAGAGTRPNEYSWSGRRYYVSLAYKY